MCIRDSNAQLDPRSVDLEAWNYIGDPLAEALIAEMRGRKLMGGNLYSGARVLEAQGNPAAVNFFRDVEWVPEWANFDRMRAGAAMGSRNPIGMMFGFHGALPATYGDPNVSKVMVQTGRLDKNGDFARRYWETATGFVDALDVDGMRPGGAGWESWVRIRLYHTMIRIGIDRPSKWNPEDGVPISQMTTAAGVFVFGQLRVNIIKALGGYVTTDEADSFALMWRWITRILGVNTELLGRTDADQRTIDELMFEKVYRPDEDSKVLIDAMIDGLNKMSLFPMSRGLHRAMVHYLLSPKVVTIAGRDVTEDAGVSQIGWLDKAALQTGVLVLTVFGQIQRVPAIARTSTRLGLPSMAVIVNKGLGAKKADFKPVGHP